jgi:hypothetical protein
VAYRASPLGDVDGDGIADWWLGGDIIPGGLVGDHAIEEVSLFRQSGIDERGVTDDLVVTDLDGVPGPDLFVCHTASAHWHDFPAAAEPLGPEDLGWYELHRAIP